MSTQCQVCGFPFRGTCYVCQQLTDPIESVLKRWAEAASRGSSYAQVCKYGVLEIKELRARIAEIDAQVTLEKLKTENATRRVDDMVKLAESEIKKVDEIKDWRKRAIEHLKVLETIYDREGAVGNQGAVRMLIAEAKEGGE